MSQHPKVLPYVFLTEMWERFGFYTVQGTLVLFLTSHLGFSDSKTYLIMGFFSALVYISPLVGGYLASKKLGYETAIVWGGFFLVAGYAILALPLSENFIYTALATIIIGNGLFKPNISSLLGTQYSQNDPKRESGFTIFYIGINIGAFLAGATASYIQERFGWQVIFMIASLGMIVGIITFSFGLRYLTGIKTYVNYSARFSVQIVTFAILTIISMNFLLSIYSMAQWLLQIVGVLLFIPLTLLILQQEGVYKKQMILLCILIASSIVYWMIFFQIFSSINLFVDRLVNKEIFGVTLGTTVFWGLEGIYIILLGPIFAFSWYKLDKMNKNPSMITKFIVGLIFAGLSCILLGISINFPNSEGQIDAIWIVVSFLILTIGELFISPIGLSAVTRLAPPHLVGPMMGLWFVATGFGSMFAGIIGKMASIPDTVTENVAKLAIYQQAFYNYAYFGFAMALILIAIRLTVKNFARIK